MRRKTPLVLLLVVWSLLSLPAEAWATADGEQPAGPVHLRVSVDRDEISIGDHLRYTLTISAEPGVEVSVPLFHERIGEFDIIDFGREPDQPQADRTVLTQWYTLTIFTTGYQMLPAPRLSYTRPDGSRHEVTGEALRVHVASLLTQEGQPTDIRDIKPPEDVPFNWWPVLVGGAVLVGLVGLGLALSYFLNRFRRAAVLPPRPAHEVAIEALSHLRAKRLPQAGQFEAYYIALSAIVRTYLEDGLRVRAPEMTTEEFLMAVTRDSSAPRSRSARRPPKGRVRQIPLSGADPAVLPSPQPLSQGERGSRPTLAPWERVVLNLPKGRVRARTDGPEEAINPSRLPSAHRYLLGTFLAQADLVKFARHRPSLDESDAAYEAAKRFVEETRPGRAQTLADEHNRPQEERHAAA